METDFVYEEPSLEINTITPDSLGHPQRPDSSTIGDSTGGDIDW